MPWLDDSLKSIKTRSAALVARVSPKARRRIAWTGGSVVGGLVGIILVLGVLDWNMLKGPVERVVSAKLNRTVHIDGDLNVHILSLTPNATVRGLRIENPKWVGGGDTAQIDRLALSVKLLPLFRGKVIMPLVQADRPTVRLVRQADGQNNWTFGKKKAAPLSLPAIRRFEIKNGAVTINDAQRRLLFAGRVNSREVIDNRNVEAFRMVGDGTLNQAPFGMTLIGGPLINVDPDRPYPFNGHIRAGDNFIEAQGSIAKPFNLAVFDTTLHVRGQDLSELYHLTGLALPNTPPYELTGHMARRTNLYTYSGVTGRFGGSDIAGVVSVRTGGESPYLSGDLRSRHLQWTDLAALVGGCGSASAGAKASPEQAQRVRRLAASDRMLPDTPLRVERLRTMDAHVKYAAQSITSKSLPLRAGSVDVTLDAGLMTMNPIELNLPNGRIGGSFVLDARRDIPTMNADLRLSGARIDQFIPAAYKGAASGPLMGRARLSASGVSVSQAAATADGQVSFVIPSGEMRSNLAELLGVNLLRALFDNPQKKTELRCAVADFKVTNGVMRAQTIVLDTGPVIATGGGTINLKDEVLDLHIKGHPKEARLIRLRIPLEITGPFRNPHIGAEPGQAVGQAGLAAFVATVLSPLAVILPFVDSGLAKDANCQALIAQAGSGKPAPVLKPAVREKTRAKAG